MNDDVRLRRPEGLRCVSLYSHAEALRVADDLRQVLPRFCGIDVHRPDDGETAAAGNLSRNRSSDGAEPEVQNTYR